MSKGKKKTIKKTGISCDLVKSSIELKPVTSVPFHLVTDPDPNLSALNVRVYAERESINALFRSIRKMRFRREKRHENLKWSSVPNSDLLE